MSGFVPTVEGWTPELASRRGLPLLITHGTGDRVISVEFARDARARAEAARLASSTTSTAAAISSIRGRCGPCAWVRALVERLEP